MWSDEVGGLVDAVRRFDADYPERQGRETTTAGSITAGHEMLSATAKEGFFAPRPEYVVHNIFVDM